MSIIIAGTGTDVGKTIFSLLVMGKYAELFGLKYWKPIQTGSDSDKDTIQSLIGLKEHFFENTAYSFSYPASPYYSSSLENKRVDIDFLISEFQSKQKKTIIELAGGLMVPLTKRILTIDLLEKVNIPIVLVGSTTLGTINHTLLSIEAMKQRKLKLLGFYLLGKQNELIDSNIESISSFSNVPFLGYSIIPERIDVSCINNFDKEGQIKNLLKLSD